MEISSTIATTAWQSGHFRVRGGRRKLLFGFMYEDAAIELRAFQPGGRIFCIASAGCTAMKLARYHDVVAVDINPVQLAYVRQRLAGGPIQRGSAEHILAVACALAPAAGWKRRTVRAFLDLDNPNEQLRFWRRHLDTWRFRAASDFLFSRCALRSIYSNSFLDFLPSHFGAVLRGRMKRCFALHSNRENLYARLLLLGKMYPAEHAPAIKQIRLICADAAAFLERQPGASFTGFCLSNILDGTNAAYERRLFAAMRRTAAPDAIVVLRSFREPRYLMPANHAAEDRAMLWGIVDVRPASMLENPLD